MCMWKSPCLAWLGLFWLGFTGLVLKTDHTLDSGDRDMAAFRATLLLYTFSFRCVTMTRKKIKKERILIYFRSTFTIGTLILYGVEL